MSIFDIFKRNKKELSDEQKKWNKLWKLWEEEKVKSPYRELMTYQSEINNGRHDQYFCNIENTGNLQNEIAALATIWPVKHKNNLQKAYRAYLILSKNEDNKNTEEVLEQCDDFFFQNEMEFNQLLEAYANKIQL